MANTMSKYGSNTNRPLSEIVGLSTDTKPTDSIEGVKIQNGSSFRELDTGKKFLFDAENTTWNEVSSGGGGGGSTLIEKSISANGVYNASEDSADRYSKVTVDVSNSYTAQDEGKVVDNGALVAQTAMSSDVTENGTVDTTLYNSVTVNVPSGGGDSDLVDLIERDITSIEIPNSVTTIGSSAFRSCNALTSIEIPNSVTTIGTSAFQNCTNLTSVSIGNTVTDINQDAFNGCSSLTSVSIGNSVTTIGSSTFTSCSNLTTITINKAEGSISGAPWGATNATVIWTG